MAIPQQALTALCRQYGVAQLHLFSSAATPRFDPARSDVDVLMTLLPASPLVQGEALLGLWDGLENLFGRRVDLLTTDSLRNPVLKAEIERTKQLLYDTAKPEISA
jgi:predicted nucleotidyltransferase